MRIEKKKGRNKREEIKEVCDCSTGAEGVKRRLEGKGGNLHGKHISDEREWQNPAQKPQSRKVAADSGRSRPRKKKGTKGAKQWKSETMRE